MRISDWSSDVCSSDLAGILGFGLVTGRPLLEALLGSAYPGLNALGWRKLTRNWAVFFVAMALLNEIVWRSTSWDFWVGFKLWGALPLTFLFALANVPKIGIASCRERVCQYV